MAALSGLSPAAFSRFFHKMTHQTFVAYRNSCRGPACLPAAWRHRSPDHGNRLYACGFGNLANFNRRFLREKGMAPRDYRRLHNPVAA